MKIGDLAELAGRNLREALLRNSLTTMGIAVGVASLVAMLSLGVGLQNLANDRLARTGLFDAIFVTPRSNYPGFGAARRAGHHAYGTSARPRRGRPAPIASLASCGRGLSRDSFPHGNSLRGKSVRHRCRRRAGIRPRRRRFRRHERQILLERFGGRGHSANRLGQTIIDPAGFTSRQRNVLRYAERQSLPPGSAGAGKDSSPGGFSIVPHEKNLRVIGIVETEPAAGIGGFGRGRLLIPLEVAETLQATQTNDLRDLLRDGPARRSYESLTVRVNGTTNVKAAEDAIKQMGFSAFSLLDASRNLSLVFAVFDLFLGIFGSLALVVASLGIINTLVMAILERRREIGVLKALGAADRDIRRLFFVEAGAMGLLGGIFGVCIGWLIGHAINFGTEYLFEPPLASGDQRHRRSLVDGCRGHRLFHRRKPRRRNLSRISRGPPGPSRGPAL